MLFDTFPFELSLRWIMKRLFSIPVGIAIAVVVLILAKMGGADFPYGALSSLGAWFLWIYLIPQILRIDKSSAE
jgi:hypothetical protein